MRRVALRSSCFFVASSLKRPYAQLPSFAFFAVGALFVSLSACGGSEPVTPSGAAGTMASGGAGTSGGSAGVMGSAAGTMGETAGTMGTMGSTGAAGTMGAAGTSGAAGTMGAAGTTGGAGTMGAAGMSGAAGRGGAGMGAAGATGGGGTGAAAYNPCPTNGDACRLMPLGDSITDGCCGENTKTMGGSYRVELFHLAVMNNKKLTFVGSGSSGPNMVDNLAFPRRHEGHSGWTIADGGGRSGLQQKIVGWLNAAPPDIVTLMIGTNDVDINLMLSAAPARLKTLVDTIIATKPNALVVLAQMVPTRKDDENVRVRAFNDAMPALVQAWTDAGKHVVLVDIYGAFTKNPNFKTAYLANDLHPSDAGYNLMGDIWWEAIKNVLPAK